MCDRWLNNYYNFLEDMGRRPSNKTLDRRDNDGDYTPENCKWSTWSEQQRNKRSFGKTGHKYIYFFNGKYRVLKDKKYFGHFETLDEAVGCANKAIAFYQKQAYSKT